VGAQETRKLAARRDGAQGVWSGLGMFGLIGWSVAAPTVLGTLAGMWLDKRHAGIHSWTMTLLIIGLCIGCLNAWHWVAKEEKAIHANQERDD
jgi:ATP synthase protein I